MTLLVLLEWSFSGYYTKWPVNWPIYRYFEKDCRKMCTRQSRTVSWVVLNALSFKEVWKNDTRGHGRMFVGAKKRNKSRFDWATVSGTVYWSYPILPFGIVACTFCPTTFLEIAVYAGADLGGGCRGCAPPWEDLPFSNTTGILQKKEKTMWLIGVEVEQETSAPPPKKNPGSARDTWQVLSFILLDKLHKYLRDFRLSRFDDPKGLLNQHTQCRTCPI